MTCSNNKIPGVFGAICAALAILTAGSCTEVDDRLGGSLLPTNQRMQIEITSPEGGVNTYLYRHDSVPSSRFGRAFFGRMEDADGVFGAQTSSVLLQFLPTTTPYTNIKGYGTDPIVDSMMIVMPLHKVVGDTTQMQTFEVYDVKEGPAWLSRDSTYYRNFPIEEYLGEAPEPLFTFTHKGRRGVAARLFPTGQKGKDYLDSIVRIPWDHYISDSLFPRKFHGLYITPAQNSPRAAAIYSTDLAGAGLELYVRNHDSIDRKAIFDTITSLFAFTDTDQTDKTTGYPIVWDNVSINMSSFDYTGSVLGTLEAETNGFTDTLPDSPTRSVVYVQPMGGVGAYLRFTDQLIDQIRSLRLKTNDAGEVVGKDILINQAMMTIHLEDPSIPMLDASLARLGSYTDMTRLTPIPDYQYKSEALTIANQSANARKYMLPYNGYLNRSNSYYELDITAYVQALAKVNEDKPEFKYISPVVYLAPEAPELFGFGESVLKGTGSERPISIRITYTIIEG